MRLILLGSPGAGKGTQASFITQQFKIPQISTGDMLREAIRSGSSLGKEVQNIMQQGKLVSDDIMTDLVKERVSKPDCKNGFILDGFPRTIPQAEALDRNGITLDYVIEIRVPDDVLMDRLTGRRIHPPSGRIYHIHSNPPKVADKDDVTGEPLIQRHDDHEETIKQRLQLYHSDTEPLVRFYQDLAKKSESAPRYVLVEGVGTVADIRDKIFNILKSNTKISQT